MTSRPHVWVDPGRCSGRPALAGHRLPTETVGRYYADLGLAETCTAYGIERAEVLVCCWFEARYGMRRLKRLWRQWLDDNEGAMWLGEWDAVPDPPLAQKEGYPITAPTATVDTPDPSPGARP